MHCKWFTCEVLGFVGPFLLSLYDLAAFGALPFSARKVIS